MEDGYLCAESRKLAAAKWCNSEMRGSQPAPAAQCTQLKAEPLGGNSVFTNTTCLPTLRSTLGAAAADKLTGDHQLMKQLLATLDTLPATHPDFDMQLRARWVAQREGEGERHGGRGGEAVIVGCQPTACGAFKACLEVGRLS